jgi:hypothetical protein
MSQMGNRFFTTFNLRKMTFLPFQVGGFLYYIYIVYLFILRNVDFIHNHENRAFCYKTTSLI